MLEKTDSKIFTFIIGLSALTVAFAAAVFSITGISMLYSGEMLYVALAMGALELSKIVVASYLYRYWKETSFGLKAYLSIALVVLMIVTSGGIYGYLTNSYQGATIGLDKINSQTQVLEQRKENLIDERERLKSDIASLRAERQSTIENRNNEIKTNNLATDSTTIKYRAYRNRKIREDYDTELVKNEENISRYTVNLDSATTRLSRINNDISDKSLEMIDTGVDVGPLVYMARIFNTTMDTVMKWFTLVIVLVFDPLAVALIIAYNAVVMRGKGETQYKIGVDIALPEDEQFDLGEPDDLSFMDDAKPVEQAFDELQQSIDEFVEEQKVEEKRPRFSKPNVKKEVPDLTKSLSELVDDIKKESTKDIVVPVESEYESLKKLVDVQPMTKPTDVKFELDGDFAEILNETTKNVGKDKPTKERIVLEPAKSGDIPKEKIEDAVKKVKHQNEFFDKMRDEKKDKKKDETEFQIEVKKKKTIVSSEDIRNFFEDAVRKVKKEGQGTITRTPFQAGGSVNVGHIEDDPDTDYSIKE